MVFRRFYIRCLATTFILTALWISVNIYLDEFGIFRDVSKRELRIYTSERLAKYLFSLHYIPEKFNGVLIGPSFSDIIDTRGITAATIYNLSLTGANATELRRLFENVMRKSRKMEALIICVDPFITRKTGMEELELDSRLLWSSLGSTSIFDYYKKKNRALRGKVSPDMSINSEWGRYHYIINRAALAREAKAAGGTDRKPDDTCHIDPVALEDLKAILRLARQRDINILAYYHPYSVKGYKDNQKKLELYKSRMTEVFGPEIPIWDFNDSRYHELRSDDSNYLDEGHLSDKGAAYLTKELNRLLAEKLAANGGPAR